jgi:hypothetical protein
MTPVDRRPSEWVSMLIFADDTGASSRNAAEAASRHDSGKYAP